MKKITIIILILNFTVGCANYLKRKNCEKINWQEYGYNLAMKGVRPGEDNYVAECRKVEAEMNESVLDTGFKSGMSAYCKPDQAYLTGKKGDKINLDFCEPGAAKILSEKHKEGVQVYCSSENAYIEGTSGRAYTGICPPDKESSFNKEYRKGRKKYVQTMISTLQLKHSELEARISSIRKTNEQLTLRMALLPQPRTIIERTYDPVTHAMKEDTKIDDPYATQRMHIRRELDDNTIKASTVEHEQNLVRDDLNKYQIELAGLD